MKSFTITTLGCKVNRYESEAIAEQLDGLGHFLAEPGDTAGICVVNTCAVTGKAAMQSRQAVRRTIRDHPGATVVVTGCCAQVTPEVFASMPNVHYVIGNTFKDRIARLADQAKGPGRGVTQVGKLSQHLPFQDLPLTRFGSRTRAFIKIQDGCDAYCSYCIIPYARGRSRSLNPDAVAKRVAALGAQGHSEIVLCGIHMGRYGQDLDPPTSLSALMQSLGNIQGVQRLRLSSIEPMEIPEALIECLATSDRICPHLHIPLQSGDDDVLKTMNRPYTVRFFRDLVYHIVRMVPHLAIGIDVMGGFPGEDDRAFENTCRLLESLPVAYLHVFPFSVQKGTAAETLKPSVPPGVIKKRCRHLRKLGQSKRMRFYEKSVGMVSGVLIEGKRDHATGYLGGFTDNYVPVLLEGDDRLFHRIVDVKIDAVRDGRVFGTCLDER